MARAFVSIGSNLGDRLGFLQKAVEIIESENGFSIEAVSSVYETEPVGRKDQPWFLNAALELQSFRSPDSILADLKRIERAVGRTPSEKWGPREIDLDLIYVGDMIVNSPSFVLPHPEAIARRFVLTPLAELAPDFVDPVRRRTMRELLEYCSDPSEIKRTTLRLSRPNAGN